MTTIERLPSDEFLPRKDLFYSDIYDHHLLFDKIAFRSNVILEGPKGVGKSLSLTAFAAKEDVHLVSFSCSEDVRRTQLLGQFILRGNETPFVLGPVTTAFEVANETGACILLLEEINALTPQMQKVLNSITDFRKRIEVPEAQKVFQLKNDAKLWIVGTMNGSAYGGVYELNEDLKSRFRILPVDYPKEAKEKEVVKGIAAHQKLKLTDSKGLDITDKIITQLLKLAHETRQRAMEYALSTRDIVQILEDSTYTNLQTAILLAAGKFEEQDRQVFLTRASSIFKEIQSTIPGVKAS